jgi:hypothetical protein
VPPDHPAREALKRLAGAGQYDDSGIDYRVWWTLLHDLLHAAGGVELHAVRVLAALDRSQERYDALVAERPEFAYQPGAEQHHAIGESLAWDYSNLLTWLRAVEERVERASTDASPALPLSPMDRALVWLGRKRPGLQCRPRPVRSRIGLIPAIAEEALKSEVTAAFGVFKHRVGDERRLANYGLHAAKVPDPNTPYGKVMPDGTLVVPIPDPPEEPVHVFDQFSYAQGRDLRTFAEVALEATDEFTNAVLDAFDRANARAAAARAGSAN